MRSQRCPGLYRRLSLLLASSSLAAAVCSCSSVVVVDKPLEPAQERLMKIHVAYMRFSADQKRPPQNVDELKPFLAELGNADDILRSPRDGQPFVVCWGVDMTQPPASAAKSMPVVAYEKQGVNGRRYVLTAPFRKVEVLSDQEFRQASFPRDTAPVSERGLGCEHTAVSLQR